MTAHAPREDYLICLPSWAEDRTPLKIRGTEFDVNEYIVGYLDPDADFQVIKVTLDEFSAHDVTEDFRRSPQPWESSADHAYRLAKEGV